MHPDVVIDCFLDEHASELTTTEDAQTIGCAEPVLFHACKDNRYLPQAWLSCRNVTQSREIIVVLPTKLAGVIQVLDKTFEVFIERDRIAKEVSALADQINRDYEGKDVIFIAVLNGSFMFASDLMKKITLPAEISFVKVSSYHGTETTGRVDELIGLNSQLKGKDVIILEDIIDTGITIDKIWSLLEDQSPDSVKICTLLYKPEAFRGEHQPDYVGFEIPNAFVVGYGLDYDEKGRNLDAIYQIRQ